jgi:mannose-1-phosphate guanylyltransferase/mannose-6-phosphate isomerase
VNHPSRYACIMAGGAGKRFWPVSRRDRPKHLLPVVGDTPLLSQTVQRLVPHVGAAGIMVVTNQDQTTRVRQLLEGIAEDRMLVEPVGRNTAACIALASRWVVDRAGPDCLIGFFPSDHLIGDLDVFAACLSSAWNAALQDMIVTFGIVPTRPETGYGYIETKERYGHHEAPAVWRVEAFREKPDRATALNWVQRGSHFWNSGIFVGRAGVFWSEIEQYLPETAAKIESLGGDLSAEALARKRNLYESLPNVSIDHGIMEKSDRLCMVEARFSWDDVGSWEAASNYWAAEHDGNRTMGSDVLLISCRGCRVRTEKRLVALIGMEDTIVVETEDAILVCKRDSAQDVKRVVQELERTERGTYL